jgi:inner membrane protein
VIPVAAALAVLPDLDVFAFALDIPYAHALGHRGFSHSLSFAALAGLGAAVIFFRQPARFSRSWWRTTAILALAAGSHGLLDAFTDAGLGIGFFIPFDDSRYFFPWRPLATSPIGVTAFFSWRPLAILASEFVWVWLPVLACAGLALLGRKDEARSRKR